MKILFCPSHYALLNNRGSELEWAYKVTNLIASRNKNSVAVTGFSNIKDTNYQIIHLQKKKRAINLGVVNTVIFSFLYGIKGIKLLRDGDYDIHHHVLPFYIGRTFNLGFLFPRHNNVVRIIGPLQNSLPFFADNLHDQHEKLSLIKKVTNTWTTILLQAVAWPLYKLSYSTLVKADALIVVNKLVKRSLINMGIASKKIHIIPPGIDVHKYSNFPKLSNQNTSSSTVKVISTGALINRKGFDLLIRGVKKAYEIDKTISIKLTIVGDGPQRKKLEELVMSLGLSDMIIFTGHVAYEKMANYYSKADIFISMTRADSQPLMYLEAMASGLAIITSDNQGALSLIRNGETGIIVKNEDYVGMAEKLLLLTKRKALLHRIQKAAKKEVNNYDWEKSIIPQYIELYNKLINEKK